MKESIRYRAYGGKITGIKPGYKRGKKRGQACDPYKHYSEQPKDIVDACMTCPYKDCVFAKEVMCPHFQKVVYGKDNTNS